MTRPISIILVATALLFGSVTAQAAELLMLEQKGCSWCERWDEEIGPVYPKTEEGEKAPLRRVDIDKPWPDDLSDVRKEVFTPTFILVEDGKEIARMRGYAGDEFFWFLLDEMLSRLDQPEASNQPS